MPINSESDISLTKSQSYVSPHPKVKIDLTTWRKCCRPTRRPRRSARHLRIFIEFNQRTEHQHPRDCSAYFHALKGPSQGNNICTFVAEAANSDHLIG